MASMVFLFMILSILSMGLKVSQATSRVTFHEPLLADHHQQWMTRFSRVYRDELEKEMRFDVFKKNAKFIEIFNKGNRTYKLGVNEFSDWTEEEFIATHTGLKGINRISPSEFIDEMIPSWDWNVSEVARETKDWRYEGAVTPVKYQGQCAWASIVPCASSKTGADPCVKIQLRERNNLKIIQTVYVRPLANWLLDLSMHIKKGKLMKRNIQRMQTIKISPQLYKFTLPPPFSLLLNNKPLTFVFIVSTKTNMVVVNLYYIFAILTLLSMNLTISQATFRVTFNHNIFDESKDWTQEGAVTPVKTQGGCEEAYPYQVEEGSCRSNIQPAMQIRGFINVPQNNELALLSAVYSQPVSVCIATTSFSFIHYAGGVYNAPDCGIIVNHGVTLVGYGTSPEGIKYWLAKNSWGETWGENGYIRLRRDVEWPQGMCGLAQYASYPIA
ncbi:unnamed protein product, partial [Thlaspi arvense]